MKRIIIILLLILLLTACNSVEDTPVTFEDEHFEEAVRKKINKPNGDITSSDLKDIRVFTISKTYRYAERKDYIIYGSEDIESIKGIEYMINLEYFEIDKSQISRIDSLYKLENIKSVEIYDSQVWDISGIYQIESLKQLALNGNPIMDISPLLQLENLQVLLLWDVDIDLTPGSEDMKVINELKSRGVDVSLSKDDV